MSHINESKGKHLSQSQRIFIETGLERGMSVSEIAAALQKSPSTISREIRKNIVSDRSASFMHSKHPCANIGTCNRYDVCKKNGTCLIGKCSNCQECYHYCDSFTPTDCYKRLHRAPYVCNGCPSKQGCRQTKYIYNAGSAHRKYIRTLKESREGINLSSAELERVNRIISPRIQKGQPINHIYNSIPDELPCSKGTMYRYIELGVFNARNIDLHRKTRLKKRASHPHSDKATILAARTNRTYEDFCRFHAQSMCNVVEIDTVIGRRSDTKSILTIFFRNCNFMLGFLLEQHTSDCVCEVFDYLEERLGKELFRTAFPCLLGDNGCEFMNPEHIEHSPDGERRTHLFYCNPNAPYQKGSLEKNHEFIRYILPKGSSFDGLHQSDVNRMMNHINSIRRDSLSGHAPYDTATHFFPEEFFKVLHMKRIPDKEVTLNPTLLRK